MPDMNIPTEGTKPEVKPKSRMLVVCENIQAMTPKFHAALPAHITPDKFVRTVLTTLQLNPDIANCDPQSIYNECIKAAADGLVIDGREAALVKYNVKKKVNGVETWVDAAKYMPMVAGLLKKARNSGEISTIVARCVYANDKFTFICGDDEKLSHEPCLDSEPGALRLAYMVARLKDGGVVRHVMSRAQIEKRRAASKSKDSGPWKTWEDDMWVKTVLRGGSKFLPASSDRAGFSELLERDDDFYDLAGAGPEDPLAAAPAEQKQRRPGGRRGAANDKLKGDGDQGGGHTDLVEYTDPTTGEVSMVTQAEADAFALAAKGTQEPASSPTSPPPPPQAPAPVAATPAPAPAAPKAADASEPIPAFLKRTPAAPASEANPPDPTLDDVI